MPTFTEDMPKSNPPFLYNFIDKHAIGVCVSVFHEYSVPEREPYDWIYLRKRSWGKPNRVGYFYLSAGDSVVYLYSDTYLDVIDELIRLATAFEEQSVNSRVEFRKIVRKP